MADSHGVTLFLTLLISCLFCVWCAKPIAKLDKSSEQRLTGYRADIDRALSSDSSLVEARFSEDLYDLKRELIEELHGTGDGIFDEDDAHEDENPVYALKQQLRDAQTDVKGLMKLDERSNEILGDFFVNRTSSMQTKFTEVVQRLLSTGRTFQSIRQRTGRLQDRLDSIGNKLPHTPLPKPTLETGLVDCPEGWTVFGESCYALRRKPGVMTWHKAVYYCNLLGSHLVEVTDLAEQSFLDEHFDNGGPRVWIGGSKHGDVWEWQDSHSRLDFSKFIAGEPSNSEYEIFGEDCLEMLADHDYTWNDAPCEKMAYYPLCMLESSVCPQGWVRYQRYCYRASEWRMNWPDAKEFCRAGGGHLTRIEDGATKSFIREYLNSMPNLNHGRFWLDGTDKSDEGSWVWSATGKRFSYTDWNTGTGEPNNVDNVLRENCLEMRTDPAKDGFFWNDAPCHLKKNVICEQAGNVLK